jgi:cell division protein FtsQ
MQRELLIAGDGVVFVGACFDREIIETLPWLEGFALKRQKGEFLPVEGMEAVADLLARAKLEAENLYQTWEVVSLAGLKIDGEIEVRTSAGTRILFGKREDYFRQLARLDLLLDTAARAQPDRLIHKIDLTLGAHVPVLFAAVNPMERLPKAPDHSSMAAHSFSKTFPHPQIKLKREL